MNFSNLLKNFKDNKERNVFILILIFSLVLGGKLLLDSLTGKNKEIPLRDELILLKQQTTTAEEVNGDIGRIKRIRKFLTPKRIEFYDSLIERNLFSRIRKRPKGVKPKKREIGLMIISPQRVYLDKDFKIAVFNSSNQPVEGAAVRIERPEKTDMFFMTDDTGEVMVDIDSLGEIIVVAEKKGYKSDKKTINVTEVPIGFVYRGMVKTNTEWIAVLEDNKSVPVKTFFLEKGDEVQGHRIVDYGADGLTILELKRGKIYNLKKGAE